MTDSNDSAAPGAAGGPAAPLAAQLRTAGLLRNAAFFLLAAGGTIIALVWIVTAVLGSDPTAIGLVTIVLLAVAAALEGGARWCRARAEALAQAIRKGDTAGD